MAKLPSDPIYLPVAEVPRMEWAVNYSAKLKTLGPKYNIPPELVSAVEANTTIIAAFMDNFKMTKKLMEDLIRNKKTLLLVNLPNPNPLVELAVLPKFTDWPAAAVSSTLLAPHIESAELLNVNPNLTAADRTSLGLDPATKKPTKRKTAEDFNYPLVTYMVENNKIILKITRGNLWKGKVCQVVMATNDSNKFTPLTPTAKQTIEVPYIIPEGKLAATFVFQATYMDGVDMVGDWSPNIVVAVSKSNEPEMAQAA